VQRWCLSSTRRFSMDPYIDPHPRGDPQGLSADRSAAPRPAGQVRHGRFSASNTQAVPGLEYTTKMYADPTKVKDSADFLPRSPTLKQATVSSSSFDEDAFAGVMESIDKVDWRQFGARYVVLITDAAPSKATTNCRRPD